MSCEECTVDPVLTVLETLAEARGYDLIEKAPEDPEIQETWEELLEEFAGLITPRLIDRVVELTAVVSRMDKAIAVARNLYEKRQWAIPGLVGMPEYYKVTPSLFRAQRAKANAVAKLAQRYLAERMVCEGLAVVMGAANEAEALQRLRAGQSPQESADAAA